MKPVRESKTRCRAVAPLKKKKKNRKLTPWSRVLLEKLTVGQLVKNTIVGYRVQKSQPVGLSRPVCIQPVSQKHRLG
jgi:hypothetical protein